MSSFGEEQNKPRKRRAAEESKSRDQEGGASSSSPGASFGQRIKQNADRRAHERSVTGSGLDVDRVDMIRDTATINLWISDFALRKMMGELGDAEHDDV